MATGLKRKIAEELLKLRGDSEEPTSPEWPNAPIAAAMSQLQKKKLEILVDLYVDNFTEKQLRAQLDFYLTEIGQSIVAVERTIRRQLLERLTALSQETNSGGALRETSSPWIPPSRRSR